MGIVLFYLHFITPYENTDEAVIEGHATFVGPRVAGQVIRLLVRDNQRVKEGELLVEIDPSDYQAKVAQARANLASAQSPSEEAKDQLLSIVTLYESLGGGWQDEIKPEQHL
jgi:membrane fusion protein (multidrug efflux system)